jgi:dihydrodipicolinate reductase
MNIRWNNFIIIDITLDFNRPDKVLIDRENKTALIIGTTSFLTHKTPKLRQRNLRNMKT